MRHVVMAENLLLAMRLPHALDHRIVVERVRQDQAIRHQLGERGNAGLVGHIAGGEDQRRFLAVQVGKLALELDQRDDCCRRYCGCRRRRCPCGSRSRPWRRSLSDAAPCRDSRWSTRSRRPFAPPANARRHAESGRRCAPGRQRRDSAARRATGRARRRKRRDNPRDDCGDRSCGNDRPRPGHRWNFTP